MGERVRCDLAHCEPHGGKVIYKCPLPRELSVPSQIQVLMTADPKVREERSCLRDPFVNGCYVGHATRLPQVGLQLCQAPRPCRDEQAVHRSWYHLCAGQALNLPPRNIESDFRPRRSASAPQEDHESRLQRPSTPHLPNPVPRYRSQGTFSTPFALAPLLDWCGE